MLYVPIIEEVVDILTKKLHKKQFDFLINKLAMKDIINPG
jgi:hypothetical protein